MKIPRHWIRDSAEAMDAEGRRHIGYGWGWSEKDPEEARRRAREVAQNVAYWLTTHGEGAEPNYKSEYNYALDRPPREEILQELPDASGDVRAYISRNRSGVLVLNAADLFFADIDIHTPRPEPVGLFARLFGKTPAPVESNEQPVLERLRTWCSSHPDVGVRLYRTAAGFRLSIVDRPIRATDPLAPKILGELESDPLYQQMCKAQESFRARLTPKPYRIGMAASTTDFPFRDAKVEKHARNWQHKYEAAAPSFATCRLLETHGPAEIHADLAPLVHLHDKLTAAASDLPLA